MTVHYRTLVFEFILKVMKIRNLLVIGLLLASSGCNKEILDPTIKLDAATDCKQFLLDSSPNSTPVMDCIEYSYGDNTLVIRHVNAAFNCCPEELYVDLNISGDTLIIVEREKSSLCDCDCLYDLDYTLDHISKGTWWIRVKEPYLREADQEILFEVDLRREPEGNWCAERTKYPWR